MVSKKARGDATERQVAKILDIQKYLYMKSPRTMKCIGPGRWISQANDFFGLFDFVAKQNNHTFWIQVKSNPSHVSEIKPKIIEFQNKYCNATHEHCEVWLKVPRKGFIIYAYHATFHRWVKSYVNLKGELTDPFTLRGTKK